MAAIYYDTLRLSIQQGGDTDTNACIAGGLIGALVGVGNIPTYLFRRVMDYDCNEFGIRRPQWLSIKERAVADIWVLLGKLAPPKPTSEEEIIELTFVPAVKKEDSEDKTSQKSILSPNY